MQNHHKDIEFLYAEIVLFIATQEILCASCAKRIRMTIAILSGARSAVLSDCRQLTAKDCRRDKPLVSCEHATQWLPAVCKPLPARLCNHCNATVHRPHPRIIFLIPSLVRHCHARHSQLKSSGMVARLGSTTWQHYLAMPGAGNVLPEGWIRRGNYSSLF